MVIKEQWELWHKTRVDERTEGKRPQRNFAKVQFSPEILAPWRKEEEEKEEEVEAIKPQKKSLSATFQGSALVKRVGARIYN